MEKVGARIYLINSILNEDFMMRSEIDTETPKGGSLGNLTGHTEL